MSKTLVEKREKPAQQPKENMHWCQRRTELGESGTRTPPFAHHQLSEQEARIQPPHQKGAYFLSVKVQNHT